MNKYTANSAETVNPLGDTLVTFKMKEHKSKNDRNTFTTLWECGEISPVRFESITKVLRIFYGTQTEHNGFEHVMGFQNRKTTLHTFEKNDVIGLEDYGPGRNLFVLKIHPEEKRRVLEVIESTDVSDFGDLYKRMGLK